jgi:glycosyltransferase involved in cell wall biosynthesis
MQHRVASELSRFITGSQNSYREIMEVFKLPKDSLHVIYDGVDNSVFNRIPGVRSLENRLLTVNSGDTPLKGLKFLLEAVAHLKKERDIQLVIVGKPMKNGYTEGLIDRFGISDCVSYAGQVDTPELVRQYSMATMLIIPSVYEGFGLPAAEAMACGTPVVSTTAGALPEVVGNAGMLIPPANTKSLIDAINILLDNPDKRKNLAELGNKRVTKMFNWQNTAKYTSDVYQEAIENQRRFIAA